MFSYIGGKSKIGKWIYENIPKVQWKRYTEVFGGAMWVYINRPIKAKEVYYNDFNPHLYNLWLCMRYKRPELLHELFKLEPNKKELFNEFKKNVLKTSDKPIEDVPNIHLAKSFIYTQTHAFSGLIIQGTMRKTVDQFTPFIKRLSNKKYTDKIDKIDKIYNLGYKELLYTLDDKNGFFYVDPPYYGKEYLYFNAFSKKDHFELADNLKFINSMWILSYYEHDDLKGLYPEKDFMWVKKEFSKSSSRKKGKSKAEEVLIFPKKLLDYNKSIEGFFK